MIRHAYFDHWDDKGYIPEYPCVKCSRNRVIKYRNILTGYYDNVCEKCYYNETIEAYECDIW